MHFLRINAYLLNWTSITSLRILCAIPKFLLNRHSPSKRYNICMLTNHNESDLRACFTLIQNRRRSTTNRVDYGADNGVSSTPINYIYSNIDIET